MIFKFCSFLPYKPICKTQSRVLRDYTFPNKKLKFATILATKSNQNQKFPK